MLSSIMKESPPGGRSGAGSSSGKARKTKRIKYLFINGAKIQIIW